MSNEEIANILRKVAASYTIKNEKKYIFQIIAYHKAADTIEHTNTELSELYKEDKLDDLPGIGPSIKSHLIELFEKGKVKHFEEISKGIPQALFPLLDIPSFGPKKAFKITKEFALEDPKTAVDDVEKLAKSGKIAEIEGFGEKSQSDILRAITEFKKGKTKTARMVLPYASEAAEKLVSYLKMSNDVIDAKPLGSLRRMMATVGDIDIAVATNKPKEVIDYFVAYPNKLRVVEKGPTTATILISGNKQVDLMIQSPESFGSLLQHFTGSKNHNIHLREYALSQKLSLSEYGIRKKDRDGKEKMEIFNSEEKFYKALGMQWIPPEIREDTGEIELAIAHKLPKLVELKDVKGDLHLHSSYPIEPSHDMGKSTMQEMIEKAKELNYEYLGFSEHNPSISTHTKNKISSIMAKRNEFIEQLKESTKNVRIINLLETDIMVNGNLAIDKSILDMLDGTIVSIHSSFSSNKEDMTKRALAGLSHPKAKILAHPTGRMLNQRAGYELDWDKIFDFCKKQNKALEINAWPNRLDLPDQIVKQAVKYGIKLVINTDSHAAYQMNLMKYGVAVARRGWAQKDDILNTLPYNMFIRWLKS